MTLRYTQENAYILSGIDGDAYDKTLKTDQEKLQFLHDTFIAKYGWHIKQVGTLGALTSWLQGLPSACNVEWRNHAIIELAIKWKRLPKNASDTKIDRYLEKWFRFMAMRILSLWGKNGIAI